MPDVVEMKTEALLEGGFGRGKGRIQKEPGKEEKSVTPVVRGEKGWRRVRRSSPEIGGMGKSLEKAKRKPD